MGLKLTSNKSVGRDDNGECEAPSASSQAFSSSDSAYSSLHEAVRPQARRVWSREPLGLRRESERKEW